MLAHFTLRALATCQLVIAGTAWANAPTTAANDFNDDLLAITQKLNQYPLQPVQLDFAEFLQSLDPKAQHSMQTLAELTARADTLEPLDACQAITKQSLAFQLNLMTERRRLTQSKKPEYPGTFSQMPSGYQWYQHWLASWLQQSVSLTELQTMAHAELESVEMLRQQLEQNQLPTGENRAYSSKQHSTIVQAFQRREDTVNEHLTQLFNFDSRVEPVKIAPSNLPKEFPAPGIYDPASNTFIYHLQTDELPEAHMDWLFVHEGVPGHHFQHILANEIALCPSLNGIPMPMVMREGWAAYVETLGTEIGLFIDQASYAYALEWRTLRALRVLIDIGIHAHDWPDERAEALWQRYLPDNPKIMRREIARVKRWPVQAITYVYGKYLIEQALLKYATQQNEKAVRSIIFQLTNHNPLALDFVPQFITPTSDKSETAS
ncbi:DUF885 family protein [Alteromonas facilis]|uniref:DUF885 family protein n=1 Tax=Alteromonas facilis TaxID=2048004 RepID=UPI000C28F769|nr:DUF885 family protein [Alteromonas facilis]